MSRSEKSLSHQIGAHVLHATYDSRELTANGRAKFLSGFEQDVRDADPDGLLSDAEVARRVRHLKTAYFKRLALASAKARARKPAARPSPATPDPEAPHANGKVRRT